MTSEQTSFGDRARKPLSRGESAELSFEPGTRELGEVSPDARFKLLLGDNCACPDCLDTKLVQVPCFSCCQDEAVEEIKEQLDFYAEWDRELGA